MKSKMLFVTFVLLFAAAVNVFGQSNSNTNKTDTTPEPYREDEFSQG